MHEKMPAHAIAIVGLAGRFPDACDLAEFWRNIRDGVESLQAFSDSDLEASGVGSQLLANPLYVRKGTALNGADQFDAGYFGMSPREAEIIDPQQRIFLECAVEALEHAGYGGGAGDQSVGVYGGLSMNTYLLSQIIRNPAFAESVGGYQIMLGNDKDFLCTRVSYKLNLRGPSMTLQTACSTSLVAVEVACRALHRGECDMALAGGVSVNFPQRAGYLYQEGMILSPDAHCRPFDAGARGTRPGAGAGIVVLKRFEDALHAGDTIHAVIRGAAVNNDGSAKAGFTAPSVDGQVEVIATAQTLAGVDARSISYIEAHGTGTPLGDPIEIAALTRVFRAASPDVGYCRLGSLKANIGHLDAAAGVAGLIKTVLAMQHRQLPPLVNFQTANPQLELHSGPFVASARGSEWTSDGPRRAGVSSFGIGGTNAHVVLEEAPPPQPSPPTKRPQLLIVSAKSAAALERATANLAAHLNGHPELSLGDVAWTLQAGRAEFAHRRTLVASDVAEAAAILGQPRHGSNLSGIHESGVRPVAFMFSGQGGQHVGMGAGLYRSEPVYRDAVDRCASLLEPHLGLDIRRVMFDSESGSSLNETRLAQPALFTTEFALASLWMHWGVTPGAMLGHSIGEYVAAHLAGVLSLEHALTLVAARGRLMQTMAPGAMAAVHLGESALQRWLQPGIEIAAINAPELCTVSGAPDVLAVVLERLTAAGVDTRQLHTSHAFHSGMMEPVLAPFLALFDRIDLAAPNIPYVSNVTGTWITAGQATSPGYYARHLRECVQFAAGVRTLSSDPGLFMLEVGSGNVLTSMARMSLGKDGLRRVTASSSHARDAGDDSEAILQAAGRLWIAGVPLNWQHMRSDAQPRRVPLPTYPFERKSHWVASEDIGTNAGSKGTGQFDPLRLRRYADVSDWFYSATWLRDNLPARKAPALVGRWLVLSDGGELATQVISWLVARGAVPIIVTSSARFERVNATHFRVGPNLAEDFRSLIDHLDGDGSNGHVSGALCMWGLNRTEDGDNSANGEFEYMTLVALTSALQVFAGRSPVQVIHATSGAQSVLDEPVSQLRHALTLGPVLVAPQEIPGIRMRCVDLELRNGALDTLTAARALLAEVGCRDSESIVAYRGSRRWLRRIEPVVMDPATNGSPSFRTKGVYLITGGLGGMGLVFARWLARTYAARLILVARTQLPPRHEWDEVQCGHGWDERTTAVIAAICAIEKDGGEVMVVTADVADEIIMAKAVQDARSRWGEINGVIHAAGIAGMGRIAALTELEATRLVLAPKVTGLKVLVRLLGEVELDFVALMSSSNAVSGVPGTTDYTAANAVLDTFVSSYARPPAWRRMVSVGWGPWSDVGMATQVVVAAARRALWQANVDAGIPSAAGIDALVQILDSAHDHIVVFPYDMARVTQNDREARGDNSRLRAGWTTPHGNLGVETAPRSTEVVAASRPDLGTAFRAPETAIEQRLASIWTELLGVEGIGVDDDFFELGGHSLLATRVLARVDDGLGVRLALRDIFDAPTICRLGERIGSAGRGLSSVAAFEREAVSEDREELEF